MRILRFLCPLFFWSVAMLLVGCASSAKKIKDEDLAVVRFVVETAPGEAGANMRLPVSGTVITVVPKNSFSEYDITRATLVQNELGPSLLFQFTAEASRDIFRQTVSNQGRRIVTTINGQAVGAVRVNQPISQGYLVTYVEMPDVDLADLADRITRTSAEARRQLENKRK